MSKKIQLLSFKKSNSNGTALVMAIVLVAMMSLMGVALITATFGFIQDSLFYSDLNSAYFLAQAGIEKTAAYVDREVGNFNEQARKIASDKVRDDLQLSPISVRDANGNINANYEIEFKQKYFEALSTLLIDRFNDINTMENKKRLLQTTLDFGTEAYFNSPEVNGQVYLESCEFDNTQKTLKIITRGEKDGYKNRMSALIELIPDDSQTPFNVLENVKVNAPVARYDYLKDKAIVAQKNIIVTGNATVNGDVLSFGTIPSLAGVETVGASWENYGGVLLGMCPEIYAMSSDLEFSQAKIAPVSSGTLSVSGSISTLSYLHLLQGSSANKSILTVGGNTFAKAVRVNEYANYSNITFKDLYIMDNLQIDSNESNVQVDGNFYGFVDAGFNIDGSGVGDDTLDAITPGRTSSIVLNGDSQLALNKEVYIGGSTFLKTAVGTNPYLTGVSALKSSQKTMKAFLQGDSSNPDNNLYWYNSSDNSYSIYNSGGALPDSNPASNYNGYSISGTNYNLLNGASDNSGFFPTTKRGMHFKGLWESLWKNNDVYSNYLNTENIKINSLTGGKIKGFSNGAIVANGTVYGLADFVDSYDPVGFHQGTQLNCIETYFASLKTFITDKFGRTAPKLNYVAPQKTLNQYIKPVNFVGAGRIVANEPYTPYDPELKVKVPTRGFVYYGVGDVEITSIAGVLSIGGKEVVGNKGIIYNDGNIYIGEGVSFSGEIISTKNVIITGTATINYDTNVLDGLFRVDKNGDVNITGLFGLITYEVPDETTKSQRIRNNSIQVIDIKRI